MRESFFLLLAALLVGCSAGDDTNRSITDTSITLPDWEQIVRVVSLQDYNTRVVVMGVTLLGLAAGVVGSFMLLRKRALIGDALAHATLPGIAAAFLIVTALGGEGKSLPFLLAGAAISGMVGVGLILLIRRTTRIKEDAALGIVLGVFFGLGVALVRLAQNMPGGSVAGLESFIYGRTASMLGQDAWLIAAAAGIVVLLSLALLKEFSILSFDAEYAAAQGWPRTLLDMLMMALVTAVTVIGLQAVGLILIIALLIIPPAAARFWTNRLPGMLVISAGIGAISGLLGAMLSALAPRLPAGAIIVLVAATLFVISMVFGRARGVVVRGLEHIRLRRTVARQHLLRAIHELLETDPPVTRRALLEARSWSPAHLARLLRRTAREGLIEPIRTRDEVIHATPRGLEEAARLARNHRLWELYLITHADIAPSHVDRDADMIEHVLGPTMIAELEATLLREAAAGPIPSPHRLHAGAGGRP